MSGLIADSGDLGLIRQSTAAIAARYGHAYYADRARSGGHIAELWADRLVADGVVSEKEVERQAQEVWDNLTLLHQRLKTKIAAAAEHEAGDQGTGEYEHRYLAGREQPRPTVPAPAGRRPLRPASPAIPAPAGDRLRGRRRVRHVGTRWWP